MITLAKKPAKKATAKIVRISPKKQAAQDRLRQCIRIRPFAEKQVMKAAEDTGEGTAGHKLALARLAEVDAAIAECQKALK